MNETNHLPDQRVDDERVTDGPLLDLHDQLVAAIERRSSPDVIALTAARTRRRRTATRLLGAAAATIALVIGVLVIGAPGDRPDVGADVSVQRQGDTVTVSIEKDVDVRQIETAMRNTGVKVKVVPTPTGPSRVNQFVGLIGPPSSKLLGGDGTSSNKATFVKGSSVQILLGVAADGRPYDVPTDAWVAGEPLAGTNLEGQNIAEAGDELARRAAIGGLTLDFRGNDGQPTTPQPTDVIADAQATSSAQVLVMLRRG